MLITSRGTTIFFREFVRAHKIVIYSSTRDGKPIGKDKKMNVTEFEKWAKPLSRHARSFDHEAGTLHWSHKKGEA